MDTCIAIIMYCYYNVLPEAIFVVYWFKFFSWDLLATNICLHAKFQVRWCYSFGSTALQQDLAEEEGEEELESAVFPTCYVKIHLFLVNIFIFVF